MTKETMHELEDGTMEITQSEQERENRVKKKIVSRDW